MENHSHLPKTLRSFERWDRLHGRAVLGMIVYILISAILIFTLPLSSEQATWMIIPIMVGLIGYMMICNYLQSVWPRYCEECNLKMKLVGSLESIESMGGAFLAYRCSNDHRAEDSTVF